MTEQAQFTIFLRGLVKPIINEAIEEALIKALAGKAAQSQSTPPTDDFLSVDESAKLLNVARQTIYQNKSKGVLKAHKRFGKLFFRRSDLIKFLEDVATPINKKGGKI